MKIFLYVVFILLFVGFLAYQIVDLIKVIKRKKKDKFENKQLDNIKSKEEDKK